MKRLFIILFSLCIMICLTGCTTTKADKVVVDKSQSKLYVMKKGKPLKEYKVAFGSNPVGHKEREGDGKTPEGKYTLDYKNSKSKFYKSIHISYPNAYDIAKANALGVSPGGDIMIHGQRNGYEAFAAIRQKFNWTEGCIALTNKEMEEVWHLVEAGTPIEIRS